MIVPRVTSLFGRHGKAYGTEFWALRNISFDVRRGESVALVGRNGSGKSTLLQLIAGTLAPTFGEIRTNGRVAALLELGSGFSPEFTGTENIRLSGAILGLDPYVMEDRLADIAAFAGIGSFIDQPVKTYSSGMMVRLAFAVSACMEPDVLIVDEALAVGDASFQFKCLERINALREKGTTLLFVSHDMEMVRSFCDQAIYLSDGEERARGAPEEVAERYFMDMRNEQRGYGLPAVESKPVAGGGAAIAFGTSEGRIIGASFEPGNQSFYAFSYGEPVAIRVDVEYCANLFRPHLSVMIQDSRTLQIGGRYFELPDTEIQGRMSRASLGLRFLAKLAAGRYHVTIRLESRTSRKLFRPIDKQVGLLSFEVFNDFQAFTGVVDLGISAVHGPDQMK